MLPDALSELVREAGGEALLLDARRQRALLTDTAELEGTLRKLANAGFTRLVDFSAQHLGTEPDGAQEFALLATLRHPRHAHAALTVKWKWRTQSAVSAEGADAEAPAQNEDDKIEPGEDGDATEQVEPGYNGIGGVGQSGEQSRRTGPVPLAAHPTLSRIWPAAALAEREIFEMLGIPFANNEQLGPLLLDEQFPGYPLRRGFRLPQPESYAAELLEQRHEEALLSLLPQAEEPLPIAISLEHDTPEAADDAHE